MRRPTSKRLIVNADGYGFTPGVNRGIEEVLDAGLVRSMSCTPNFGYLDRLLTVVQRHPHVSIGVHVNLSVGPPVSPPLEVASLLGEDGRFVGDELFGKLVRGQVDAEHIRRELRAQVALFTEMGIAPTHIDGHQNRHLYPRYFGAVLEIAREAGIRGLRCHKRKLWGASGPLPLNALVRYYATHPTRALSHSAGRVRMLQARRHKMRLADGLITPGYADSSHKSHEQFWRTLADTLPPGTWEVYCHPAYVDDVLKQNATYVEPREIERVILGSESLERHYDDAGVSLISFHELVNSE